MPETPPLYALDSRIRIPAGDVWIRKTWVEDGVRLYLVEWPTKTGHQPVSLTEAQLQEALRK